MLTNKGNTVLYTGVTDDVQRRLFEHRKGSIKTSFTWRYQFWKLVFVEEFGDLAEAIEREKQGRLEA
ncbi:MAG: GIY-YIG nuclease family protein [Flavobacteriales bacterium]|nr:GIY-YIG nuclease family protein [Flavobacteriales bacterium]